jgi:membrane-associated phospholipid phosphatase
MSETHFPADVLVGFILGALFMLLKIARSNRP